MLLRKTEESAAWHARCFDVNAMFLRIFVASSVAMALLVPRVAAADGPAVVPGAPDAVRSCDALRADWAKEPTPARALNVAKCESAAGRPLEVVRILGPVLRTLAPESDEEVRAQSLFVAARARVGAIYVEADVRDAGIDVDGRRVATTPLTEPIFVAAGHHTVTVEAEGRPPARRDLDVAPGASVAFVAHTVPLRDDVIGFDQAENVGTFASPDGGKSTVILVAGAAASALALATAVTFNIAANSKTSAAHREQAAIQQAGGTTTACNAPGARFTRDCAALHDALAAHDRYGNIALAAYALAGVGAAATIWYALVPTRRESSRATFSEAAVRPSPMVGAGVAGIQLVGAY